MKYNFQLHEVSMAFIPDVLDYGQPPPEEYWRGTATLSDAAASLKVADVLNDDWIINGKPAFEYFDTDMFGF